MYSVPNAFSPVVSSDFSLNLYPSVTNYPVVLCPISLSCRPKIAMPTSPTYFEQIHVVFTYIEVHNTILIYTLLLLKWGGPCVATTVLLALGLGCY